MTGWQPVAAAASVTPRTDPATTQDACWAGCRPATESRSGLAWAAVADGVGSLPDSGAAAVLAVRTAREAWEHGEDVGSQTFLAAHRHVRDQVGVAGATTLITVEASGNGAAVRWVGNGGVLLTTLAAQRRSDRTAPDQPSVLWTDLLVPHVAYVDGRDVLERVLGGRTAPGCEQILVGASTRPRLLLAVTDGLHSAEQLESGTTDDGSYWQRQPTTLRALLQLARDLLTSAMEPLALQQACAGVLTRLLRQEQLDDDATVAAVLLPACPDQTAAPGGGDREG